VIPDALLWNADIIADRTFHLLCSERALLFVPVPSVVLVAVPHTVPPSGCFARHAADEAETVLISVFSRSHGNGQGKQDGLDGAVGSGRGVLPGHGSEVGFDLMIETWLVC
jgi:hypothetical protein